MNIAPQNLSALGNNFAQPYSNQFQQVYLSTFDLLGDESQTVNLLSGDYYHNGNDMEEDNPWL